MNPAVYEYIKSRAKRHAIDSGEFYRIYKDRRKDDMFTLDCESLRKLFGPLREEQWELVETVHPNPEEVL